MSMPKYRGKAKPVKKAKEAKPFKGPYAKITKSKWREVFQIIHACRGLSHAVIADAAGLSVGTVSRIRNVKFRVSPRDDVLRRMGEAVGLHRRWLTLDLIRELKIDDFEDKAVEAQATKEYASLIKDMAERAKRRGNHKGGTTKPVTIRERRDERPVLH